MNKLHSQPDNCRLAAFWQGCALLQVPLIRGSLRFLPPLCLQAVLPTLFRTERMIVSPPGAISSNQMAPERIQLTWIALRSTYLHLKGCRSSLAIHRRCLVLCHRRHLCRRRHRHHLCHHRRRHLLPCQHHRLFHLPVFLHLRRSWPGHCGRTWTHPRQEVASACKSIPSGAPKARPCCLPLCTACKHSRHVAYTSASVQLRLSCRRREH